MKRPGLIQVLLVVFALAAPVVAQPKPPADPGAPAPVAPPAPGPGGPKADNAGPDTLKLHMMDGSVITGTLVQKEIVVETQYGTLKVPLTDLKSLTPGLQSHPEFQAHLDTLVERLGSPDYPEREAAQKELGRLGTPVRAELQRHQKDGDTERSQRIQALLDEMDEGADGDDETAAATPPAARQWVRRDVVETREFSIAGRIVAQKFDVVSAYGPLTVKISDIRHVQRSVTVEREDLRKTIAVDGTNQAPGNLKDTHIHLEKGDTVTFAADGQLTMTPWGNGAIVGPEGGPNYAWFIQGKIPGGSLVARLGKGGEVFKLGAKHTLKVDTSGDLYLGIGIPQEYATQNFPGGFNVKLVVKPHP